MISIHNAFIVITYHCLRRIDDAATLLHFAAIRRHVAYYAIAYDS